MQSCFEVSFQIIGSESSFLKRRRGESILQLIQLKFKPKKIVNSSKSDSPSHLK